MGWDPKALAVQFLRRSMLDEALGEPLAAGEHALWAAWAVDDERDREAAVDMRLRSSDLFQLALDGGDLLLDAQLNLKTRLIDILRRAGQWAEAIVVADKVLAVPELEDFPRSVVEFGRAAAKHKDGSCYTTGDLDNVGASSTMADGWPLRKPSTPRSPATPRRRLHSWLAAFFGESPRG
jgi:hypothetical protein